MRSDQVNRARIHDDGLGLRLALIVGPVKDDPYTDAQLARAWDVYGAQLTAHLRRHEQPGLRPWGWWEFVARREEPEDHAEAVRIIAAHGELSEPERDRIASRAAEARADRDRGDAFDADDDDAIRAGEALGSAGR